MYNPAIPYYPCSAAPILGFAASFIAVLLLFHIAGFLVIFALIEVMINRMYDDENLIWSS